MAFDLGGVFRHALQVIKDAKGSAKADVYAFGILLWELATRDEVRAEPIASAPLRQFAPDANMIWRLS